MGKLDLITSPLRRVGRTVDNLPVVGRVTGMLPIGATLLGALIVLALAEWVVLPVVM